MHRAENRDYTETRNNDVYIIYNDVYIYVII